MTLNQRGDKVSQGESKHFKGMYSEESKRGDEYAFYFTTVIKGMGDVSGGLTSEGDCSEQRKGRAYRR